MSENNEEWLTSSVAAKAVHLTRQTLNNYIRAGKLTPTFTTPGKHARWLLSDLKNQLEQLNRKD